MILDGKSLANERALLLKTRVATLKAQNIIPTLLIILVGEDPASAIYVRNKVKKCAEIGIKGILEKLEENCPTEKIIEVIEKANKDPKIDGIILQSPLPKQFNEQEIMQHIHSEKDVDGFGTLNLGHLLLGDEEILAATPLGIIRLLEKYDIPVASKNVLMIGRSQIVGRPLAAMLLNRDATVTIAHSKTKNLKEFTQRADIVISAVGEPHFITADMIKPGAVCIDVGISRVENHVVGDMDFEHIKDKASYITPVPGGVGPMTIISLLENVVSLAEKRKEEYSGSKNC